MAGGYVEAYGFVITGTVFDGADVERKFAEKRG